MSVKTTFIIFIVIAINTFIHNVICDDCWWTGCQPRSRRQRGCYRPDKYYIIESEPCNRGLLYHCCPVSGRSQANSGGNGNGVDELVETGICSWYGQNDVPQGHPTASGELFDKYSLKAAHKTLPFGTRIRVMNLKTRETVDVTINDRGPFLPGRILDLTYSAFGEIADRKKGLIKCSYTFLG